MTWTVSVMDSNLLITVTARSAVLPRQVVRPSVRPSVCECDNDIELFRLPCMHCRAWHRITLPATVSWWQIPDGDPCGPPSDVSALCHVRTALSAIDPSRLPVRGHGTSCRSVYVNVTLGYR